MDLSIPISGIQSANRRQSVTAHNIANINTPDFQAQRGAFPAQEQVDVSSHGITTDTSSALAGTSNVDLAHELVQTKINVHTFQANAKVLQAQSQLLEQGVDLLRDHS